MPLTKSAIDKLTFNASAPASAQIIWDGSIPGFGCRVFESGVKSFLLDYRVFGRKRRFTIGRYGVLTPKQARDRAIELLAEVSRGADPLAQRTAQRAAILIADAVEEYLANMRGKLKPSTTKEYRRIFDRYILPALGKRRVTDVTIDDVAKLHSSMHTTPYQANRTRDVLAILMRWSEVRGYRPRHTNPCTDVRKFAEHKRERFLTMPELGRLGAALQKAATEGLPPAPALRKKPKSDATRKHRPVSAATPIPANPFATAAIRFLALSGWREREALTLRWSDVDFARRIANLPDTKTGKSYRVLSADAVNLLQALPRVAGSPYAFPGRNPAQPLQEIKRIWYAVRYAAQLPELRLHDLRHTVASVSAERGNSLYLTGLLLGHTRVETTQRYAHLHDDVLHAAADEVGAAIAAAMTGGARELAAVGVH
jgi:integrase